MKNILFAAFAALGLLMGTTAMLTPANAAQQAPAYQAGSAGGEG